LPEKWNMILFVGDTELIKTIGLFTKLEYMPQHCERMPVKTF